MGDSNRKSNPNGITTNSCCLMVLAKEYNDPRNGVSNGRMEVSETKTIAVVLNGEPQRVPQGFHVDGLLEFLAIDPARVAVELNRSIIRKTDWGATPVEDGAEIEVVWFVGGGSGIARQSAGKK